jgi:hypothetical protein
MTRIPVSAVVALLAAAPAARAADPIEAALKAKAPALVEALKQKGFKNVGVLKFLARQGDGPARDDVGDLNRSLANKTQIALCLALKPDDTFGIIHDPSGVVVAEKMTRANHLTPEGRQAFFERKFGLVWSGDKVEPSGFLAGTVTLSPDLKRMTLSFQAFDKTGALFDLPGEISAPANPEELAEAGFSYVLPVSLRKALVSGDPPPTSAVREAAVGEIVRTAGRKADAFPSPEPPRPFSPLADCPVTWTIRYNGKPVPVTGTTVPEPAESDRVSFVLSNPGPDTYAVVLLVNGANTLYEERAAPLACRKWVLPPGAEVTVRGFQTGPDTVTPFKVLPPEEAEPDVVRYGDHAGTYRMVVYQGKLADAQAPAPDTLVLRDRDETVIAMARGSARPDGAWPQTLADLQNQLRGRTRAADFGRGYVGKGTAAEENATEVVRFVPASPVPVADVSLRYFTPRD